MTEDSLLAELKAYEAELIDIRHDMHRHPEVGFEEIFQRPFLIRGPPEVS